MSELSQFGVASRLVMLYNDMKALESKVGKHVTSQGDPCGLMNAIGFLRNQVMVGFGQAFPETQFQMMYPDKIELRDLLKDAKVQREEMEFEVNYTG